MTGHRLPLLAALACLAGSGCSHKVTTIQPAPLRHHQATEHDRIKRCPLDRGPMLVALLIEGNGRWMGNETYAEEDGDDPEVGAFTSLAPAIDTLATLRPRNALVTVLTFGDGKVSTRFPVGPVGELSGTVMGQQRDYDLNLDVALITGLHGVLKTLDEYGDHRRILVVVGDGTGERDDISSDLAARVRQLRSNGFEVYTIFYEALASGDPTGQANMRYLGYTKSYTADSKDGIVTYMRSLVEELSCRER